MKVAWKWLGIPSLGALGFGVLLSDLPAVQAAPGAASPGATDHSGSYVLLQQTVTVAEIPILADVVATTRAVSLQNLAHEGSRLSGDGRLCELVMESSSDLVQTELPAAFRRSLPKVRIDAELAEKDGALTFRQAAQSLVVGAELKPEEALPTRADDVRVVDQDGDEKPGVTVRISGLIKGDIYLVQRSTSRLYGARRGDAFTGRIDFKVEQSILGTTNRLIGDGPESRPVPSRSFFRLQKVAQGWGCAQARQLAAAWR